MRGTTQKLMEANDAFVADIAGEFAAGRGASIEGRVGAIREAHPDATITNYDALALARKRHVADEPFQAKPKPMSLTFMTN